MRRPVEIDKRRSYPIPRAVPLPSFALPGVLTPSIAPWRYLYDGWNVVADLWADHGNLMACTYVWGIDVTGTVGGAAGIGGLALVYYNGRAFQPLQDGRGNIYGYLDTTTGKNAGAWDFTPFGATFAERGSAPGVAGSWDFLFRFQSKMQDYGGHLLYFGLRYYHPGMGRFINRDPIGEAGGLNLYGYVGNNPGNASDLLGMKEICWYEDSQGEIIQPHGQADIHIPGSAIRKCITVPDDDEAARAEAQRVADQIYGDPFQALYRGNLADRADFQATAYDYFATVNLYNTPGGRLHRHCSGQSGLREPRAG